MTANVNIKEEIKEKLTGKISKEIEVQRKELEVVVRQANDAPGAMQSHSDTTKSQMGNLASEHQIGIDNLRAGLEALSDLELKDEPTASVSAGSLIKTHRDGTDAWYMMMPVGGGQKIETKDLGTVIIITPGTPIGEALYGKTKGERLEFNEKSIEITEIK